MPCFRLPYVGARVPSTSMYAIGPSNSRPRPCHKGARTALMHSINVITSSSLKRRQKSPAVVGSGIRSAPSAFMYAVSWRKRSMSSVKSRVVCKSERKLLDASVRLPWRPPSVREA